MQILDLTLPTPAENLAADEALLDGCEENSGSAVPLFGGEEILRFWEPRETFVVVGYANKIATEVNVAACAAKKIPVFRRSSGGGTVVQMPGGLNYSLILRVTENGPTRGISTANKFIMEKNRAAIETVFKSEIGNRKSEILVRGHTDLCLGDLKFAGNSQRRRKNFLLFHGTLLLNCDLGLVGEFIRMPSKQPDYRQGRSHSDFVTNLNLPAEKVKAALRKSWNAIDELKDFPKSEIQKLAAQKYSTDEWNLKF